MEYHPATKRKSNSNRNDLHFGSASSRLTLESHTVFVALGGIEPPSPNSKSGALAIRPEGWVNFIRWCVALQSRHKKTRILWSGCAMELICSSIDVFATPHTLRNWDLIPQPLRPKSLSAYHRDWCAADDFWWMRWISYFCFCLRVSEKLVSNKYLYSFFVSDYDANLGRVFTLTTKKVPIADIATWTAWDIAPTVELVLWATTNQSLFWIIHE